MKNNEQTWTLNLGSDVIATVIVSGFEFPWTYGRLTDSVKFERYRTYFSDEDEWPETVEFDEMCTEIRTIGGFRLHNILSGEKYVSFRLNHDGDWVWFRFS